VFALDSDISGELRTPLDRKLAEVAGRQHGVVARRQLSELGFTRDAIDWRLKHRRLLPLYRAVYAVGHQALSRNGHRLAAVLAYGPHAVLSHRDAAALWGIRNTARHAIDVTVPYRGHRRSGIALHRATLTPADRTTRDAIPTTSLARTLLDLASLIPLDAVVRALEEAERKRLIDMRLVHALLVRANGHPGAGKLRRALEAYEPRNLRTRSDLERAFLALCSDAGLPRPDVNRQIAGYEVDAVWPAQNLLVELDAYRTHGSKQAFERDRLRDAVLLQSGYRTLRVTGLRLEREPRAIARAIARLLGAS
jgi:very-short-patch-repair endonuclease